MGLNPVYLVDKSVIARLIHPQVAKRMEPLRKQGFLATCGVTELEVLQSARSSSEYEQVRADRLRRYAWLAMDDGMHDRALDVQRRLVRSNHHRAVKSFDMLQAAVAESYGLTMLHYDRDYDRIAEVTGQPCEWVVPAGSVP